VCVRATVLGPSIRIQICSGCGWFLFFGAWCEHVFELTLGYYKPKSGRCSNSRFPCGWGKVL
jgi:hypothetical protein